MPADAYAHPTSYAFACSAVPPRKKKQQQKNCVFNNNIAHFYNEVPTFPPSIFT